MRGGVSTGSHSTKKEEDIHQDTVSTNKVFSSLFWGGYSETSRDKELRGCSSIMWADLAPLQNPPPPCERKWAFNCLLNSQKHAKDELTSLKIAWVISIFVSWSWAKSKFFKILKFWNLDNLLIFQPHVLHVISIFT